MNTPRQPQPLTVTSKDTLDTLLDEFDVQEVGDDDSFAEIPNGWFYVSNNDGVIAYFASESDANRFRLAEVNRRLNP